MSREERSGERILTFSAWHRRAFGDDSVMIDLDCIRYCRHCWKTYAIAEVHQIPRGCEPRLKPALVTMTLGRDLGVPAYVLGYRPAPEPCICNHQTDPACPGHGIEAFFIERLWPSARPGRGERLGWRSPGWVIRMLDQIRLRHYAAAGHE